MSTQNYAAMQDFLIYELRLNHDPVAMHFFYDEQSLEAFKAAGEYYTTPHSLTFCQIELGAKMQKMRVLVTPEKLGCRNARIAFGWKDIDETDIRIQQNFCTDEAQARRFIAVKPTLSTKNPPLALGLSPLSASVGCPDVVHFCCDNMQAYYLLDDWMAVSNTHPFRPLLCVNSSVCGGSVFCLKERQANLTLACGGSYTSGKMERGEINVMIPGADMPALIARMTERKKKTGGVSFIFTGQDFPGADICKNCPHIVFRKASEQKTE